jgi:uncharacterized protein (DUF697 family)
VEAVAEETVENTETEETALTHAEQANQIVRNYTLGAMGVSLVPVPVLDLAAIAAVQLKMLHSLANLYEIEFRKDLGKSIIASLVGGYIPYATTGTLASSFMKFVPFIGHGLALVSMPILAGATSYAVGKVFIQHFESGGTFLDLNPEEVREYFAEKFKEGEKVASEMQSSGEAKPSSESSNTTP